MILRLPSQIGTVPVRPAASKQIWIVICIHIYDRKIIGIDI